MPRKPPPPPKLSYDDQEPDEDESPTAMFVHPNPMAYDPNGPGEPHAEPAKAPVAAGAPPPPPRANLIDDDDYSEPPTAIHVPAYRPDEVPGAPPIPSEFRGAGAMPSPIGAPAQPQQAARARVAEPAAAAAAPHAAPAPMPAASVVQPAQFTPPGVAQPAAPVQPAPIPAPVPQQVVQAAPLEQAPSASHPSRVLPGPSMASAPGYDPDAAPLWLKALALGTVVSALTVLGVLGWMVAHRF